MLGPARVVDTSRATAYTRFVLDMLEIAPEAPRPLRRAEYDHLVALGAFEGERVELIRGVIVQMSPHGPAHDAPLDRLTELFVRGLGTRAKVRVQSSFLAADGSEPEPDLCVVPRRDYDDAHPNEAYLIVEVAVSSLNKDRGVKAALYAESEVAEYWVVNVVDRVIEVRWLPSNGTYQSVRTFQQGESIRLVQFSDLVVNIDDVLAPRAPAG